MRKISIMLLSLAFLLAFQVGSAFADSKLDDEIDPLIGIRYKTSGTTTAGFDCSGFTQYVFKKLGVEIPRDSRSQAKRGEKVAAKDLRAGDLVFFNTNGRGVSHVGIYVGDGKFAHSSLSKGITITSLSEKYYVKRYLFARRVIDTETYQEIATDPEVIAETEAADAISVDETESLVIGTEAPADEQ